MAGNKTYVDKVRHLLSLPNGEAIALMRSYRSSQKALLIDVLANIYLPIAFDLRCETDHPGGWLVQEQSHFVYTIEVCHTNMNRLLNLNTCK